MDYREILRSLEQLHAYKTRRFVPRDVRFSCLDEVTSLYQKLLESNINSASELEEWLLNWSELEAAVDQHGSILYIRMTAKTDEEKFAVEYRRFIETVLPAIKPLIDKLKNKFLQEYERFPLDSNYYEIFLRTVTADVELFVKENIELQKQEDILSQEYQTICGTMTVDFDGKQLTIPQMSVFLLDPDRVLREKAWRAISTRRLKDKDKLDQLFDKMVKLRHRIALNAGFDNYMEYKFKELHRFDYTPQDCIQYHDCIEKFVLPLWKKILQRRKETMGLDVLRPWDTSVDPLGRPPLKPFDDVKKLIDGCRIIFSMVDDELGERFSSMAEERLLDLENRQGKAPGGYQSTLNEARKPFIFMNAVGIDSDVWTLLHEAGHSFHSIACAHHELLAYRHAPMEFCEVASMSMELLGGEHISVFYPSQIDGPSEEELRSTREQFEDIIFTLIWVATIDAFQHWIYKNPEASIQDRKDQWLKIRQRFDTGLIDWNGLEEEHQTLWHKQLHIFEVPFYYIEYGIAQLGALQIWLNASKNKRQAVEKYKKALSLGGSRSLPELFNEAGICFDFSEKTIVPLVEAVADKIF